MSGADLRMLWDSLTPAPEPRRLGHCSPRWGGHSPACLRDGTYCSLDSAHAGPCSPHGWPAGRFADLEEDPDPPDDGLVLVAGVLYDAETGEEA